MIRFGRRAGRAALILAAFLATAILPAQPATQGIITVDYPLAGSIFPPDLVPPTFEWRDSDPRANLWVIEFAFGDGSKPLRVETPGPQFPLGPIDERCAKAGAATPQLTPNQLNGHSWKADAAAWGEVKMHAASQPVTVRFFGYQGEKTKKAVSSGRTTLSISRDPVAAPIFYRDVPLAPVSSGERGVIAPLPPEAVPLIAWRIMDLSSGRSRVMMEGLPTCANCHSFSRDGKWLGIDVDGPQNDKGLYALVPVGKATSIRNENVIRWNSFSDDPAKKRFGFMSQMSPDGQYLVTSTEPPDSQMKGLDDRLFNGVYKDYGFGQVFYPTRGILSWYSKATGKLLPLPGADDTKMVQTSAFWSPDGKYLIYSRAVARDPFPPDAKEATYANSPDETQIQYDLYRIPFNSGKGGTPQPVRGASGDGMSNDFPKVSPDGKWIVFVKNKNGLLMRPDSQLYIVPSEGGTARRMNCNLSRMNSWHSFSPNGRWLAFSSKGRSLFTQLFLTHIDENGNDSPAILVENMTAANRAVNIPEFVNIPADLIETMSAPATEFYRLFNIAMDDQGKGALEKCIAEWKTALEMSPDEPRALYNLGVALSDSKRYEDALVPLRKALELKPTDARTHATLGITLIRLKQPDEAQTQLEKAVELNPRDAGSQSALGSLLAEKGQFQEAIPHFAQALEIAPDDADTQNDIAVALVRAGKAEAAVPYLEKALAADPNATELQANLGLILARQGKFDDAVPHLEKALAGGLDSPEAHLALGRALASQRRYSDAIPHFEAVAKNGDPVILGVLSSVYASAGRLDDALRVARQGLRVATERNDKDLIDAFHSSIELYEKAASAKR